MWTGKSVPLRTLDVCQIRRRVLGKRQVSGMKSHLDILYRARGNGYRPTQGVLLARPVPRRVAAADSAGAFRRRFATPGLCAPAPSTEWPSARSVRRRIGSKRAKGRPLRDTRPGSGSCSACGDSTLATRLALACSPSDPSRNRSTPVARQAYNKRQETVSLPDNVTGGVGAVPATARRGGGLVAASWPAAYINLTRPGGVDMRRGCP
jgi:hypothetical protein